MNSSNSFLNTAVLFSLTTSCGNEFNKFIIPCIQKVLPPVCFKIFFFYHFCKCPLVLVFRDLVGNSFLFRACKCFINLKDLREKFSAGGNAHSPTDFIGSVIFYRI